MTIDYFGVDKVLFGTDAPLGIAYAGATQVINDVIETLPISPEDKQTIYYENFKKLIEED